MSEPAIEAEGLCHRFGGRTVLRDVDLCVPTGSVHAFVGPNGAGKTTTLNILATLLSPARGRVRILGVDTRREPKRVRRKVGYMPEHFAMYRPLTVFEYLDFFAAAHGQRMDHRNLVLADVVERFSLHELRFRRIGALSRGQQQRVCLARVMLHDPKVLLLDEPASGLDPRARSRLLRLVRELAKEGRTVLMSSHILGELADVCDDVTILDRGRVQFSGTMRRLLARGDGSRLRYTIDIDGAAAELCGGLQLVAGVLDATVDPEAATRLVVEVDGKAATIGPVLAALLAHEVQVRAVREDRRGLDEAFLELTSPGGET